MESVRLDLSQEEARQALLAVMPDQDMLQVPPTYRVGGSECCCHAEACLRPAGWLCWPFWLYVAGDESAAGAIHGRRPAAH